MQEWEVSRLRGLVFGLALRCLNFGPRVWSYSSYGDLGSGPQQ